MPKIENSSNIGKSGDSDQSATSETNIEIGPRNEFDVKKLKGSENYHTWQFAMLNYLDLNNLEKCIKCKDDDESTPLETEATKLKEAKARLALSVDESIFVYIRKATSALEIWTTLQQLYEDKGLLRKVGLLRTLTSVRLENVKSMHVTEIVTIRRIS